MIIGVFGAVAAWCMPTSPSGWSATCPRAGRDEDRKVQGEAEDAGARVHARGLDRRARDDVHPVEGIAVALDRPLRVGAVGGVVVDEPRDVGEEHRLEVEHRLHLGEAGHALVIAERAGIPLRGQERRPRDERGEARQRLPPGQTSCASDVQPVPPSPPAQASRAGLADATLPAPRSQLVSRNRSSVTDIPCAAPGLQGATTEDMTYIRGRSNAARRDAPRGICQRTSVPGH